MVSSTSRRLPQTVSPCVFSGDVAVPTLGRVTQLQGRVTPSETGLELNSSGVLGQPFRVSGSLTPLDLELTGQNLDVQARRLFVASSSTDVNLTLRSGGGGLTLSGGAFVNRAQLSLNRSEGSPEGSPTPGAATGSAEPPAATPTQTPAPPTADVTADTTDTPAASDPLASTASAITDPVTALGVTDATGTGGLGPAADLTSPAAVPSAAGRAANPVLGRIRFDDVTLQAPREVLFNEAFGSAELGLDLTLSGTAAEPRLEGQAQTLDGSIRFSGQDFSLTQAVATFDPARGVYPTLALGATASFDKARALGSVPENAGATCARRTPRANL